MLNISQFHHFWFFTFHKVVWLHIIKVWQHREQWFYCNFCNEWKSEIISKIDQHLAKLWTKNTVGLFWLTVYTDLKYLHRPMTTLISSGRWMCLPILTTFYRRLSELWTCGEKYVGLLFETRCIRSVSLKSAPAAPAHRKEELVYFMPG